MKHRRYDLKFEENGVKCDFFFNRRVEFYKSELHGNFKVIENDRIYDCMKFLSIDVIKVKCDFLWKGGIP